MSEPVPRRHALDAFLAGIAQPPVGGGVDVVVQPQVDLINLRGRLSDTWFRDSVEGILGHSLPAQANTFVTGPSIAYWLGPDEWLLAGAANSDIATRLESALQGAHAAVNAQHGGLLQMELRGSRVRDLLAKGCTLDLHPTRFRPGQCAQTGFARAAILLAQLDDAPTFRLLVRRSFAEYVAQYLHHGGQEFGIRFSEKA